jgi:hypothetical protein
MYIYVHDMFQKYRVGRARHAATVSVWPATLPHPQMSEMAVNTDHHSTSVRGVHDIQHNDIQHNNKKNITISIMKFNSYAIAVLLSVIYS